MKSLFFQISVMLLTFSVYGFSANWDGTVGTITPKTRTVGALVYYVLTDAKDLAWFAGRVNQGVTAINAVLENDIILTEDSVTETNLESAPHWIPIGKTKTAAFEGVFNGDGHQIKGMVVLDTAKEDTVQDTKDSIVCGLFGYIGEKGIVRNLVLKNVYVFGHRTERAFIGGLAGASSGEIKKVNVDGYVGISTINWGTLAVAGGVVGDNRSPGVIDSSTNAATVFVFPDDSGNEVAYYRVGGIAGHSDRASAIRNCLNSGIIWAGANKATAIVGGITGLNDSTGRISLCTNTGAISGTSSDYEYIGGIVGSNSGIIDTCTNAGVVSDTLAGYAILSYENYVGGIAGESDAGGAITVCVNFGSVTGDNSSSPTSWDVYAGGIVGHNYNTKINGCSNFGTVTAIGEIELLATNAGGIVGMSSYYSKSSILNCRNFGAVMSKGKSGYHNAGGIAGSIFGTAIQSSYSASANIVSPDNDSAYTGGYIGTLNDVVGYGTSLRGVYFDTTLAGFSEGIGYIEYSANDSGGRSSSDMLSNQFAWLLNTLDGTSGNSGVWSRGNGYPLLADEQHLATRRVVCYINYKVVDIIYTDSTGRLPYLPQPIPDSGSFGGWFIIDSTLQVTSATVFNKDVKINANISGTYSIPVIPNFSEIQLTVSHRILTIRNASEKSRYAITNVEGKVLFHGCMKGTSLSLRLPAAGIYFVRVGNRTKLVRIAD